MVRVRLLSVSQADAQGLKPQVLLLARGLPADVTRFMKPAGGDSGMACGAGGGHLSSELGCSELSKAKGSSVQGGARQAATRPVSEHAASHAAAASHNWQLQDGSPTMRGLLSSDACVHPTGVCHDHCLAEIACHADSRAREVRIRAWRAGPALGLPCQRLVPIVRACTRGQRGRDVRAGCTGVQTGRARVHGFCAAQHAHSLKPLSRRCHGTQLRCCCTQHAAA